MSKVGGKRPPPRLHHWSDQLISENEKAEVEDVIWLALVSQNEEFYTKPAIPPLVNLVIESMSERHLNWSDFPEWMKTTSNPIYQMIYKKIDNKFRHSVSYVNAEMERIR